VTNRRVRQAVAYFEQGNADLEPLDEMGLTAADLSDVIELVRWGGRAPLDVKAALERIYETRIEAEEKAGLAMPLVVLKEQQRWRFFTRLFIVASWLAAVVAGVLAWSVFRR